MKQITRALEKSLRSKFSREVIESLEWFPDSESEKEYCWKFRLPGDSSIKVFAYQKDTKKVVIRGIE